MNDASPDNTEKNLSKRRSSTGITLSGGELTWHVSQPLGSAPRQQKEFRMIQGKPDLSGRHTETPVDSGKFCRKLWLKCAFNPDPNNFTLSGVPLEQSC